ncbi:amino acid transporter [Campylobacter upsaliensis]|uniref:LysE/ArgO family amino acid transporter n=1 Tax=Campylobacter upsaliensis TaxID=28080 RepID=UPI000E1217F7|nr:LysE/ArgO family amino acid transporter [Campylobacter upsaliensis]EAH5887207.1 amino acid transporter [Campylobacter upsaliensis]EAH8539974.1 amino acid transporter [Campylobacter upsaliensis]EAI1981119.1 amino acid transporter [Campylobacter upsaliensis]EAI4345749.1 amino acid transporter [Campylobacter upsaliensis]EAI4358230.1 amino acid transporter [Campylobacter upsaliensis]
MMTPLFKGFLLSLSLIVAIGAQNVFILRQALANHYIFIVCLLCFLCDVVLMCVGIFGVGEIFAKNQILALILAFCGVCFALYYAFLSLRAVFANSIKLQLAKEKLPSLKKVITLTLFVTLANPHVYLDTVFLVGSAALNFSFDEKILFALGALSASFLWFFSLGYGAKFLSFYIKPNFVKIIDLFVCFIMCMVAYSLILYILERI